ncbi:4-hydroxythreonine-4-phosphate dehydrogenase PdxA [Candidatus Pelagibacter sp.]|jgi:4-hydroxythreonine-4-phosphate dehydrogenase|nr:4-hydroxythreonine-4-phosphate dehydrogenase PdxA [Candidatus Pelagibacter sp.]
MKFKPILIVAGEPNSIFFEIFLKTIKNNKFRSPIILIASKKILEKHIRYFKYKIKFKEIDFKKNLNKINPDIINLINIEYNQNKIFENISKKSNAYIKKSFDIALQILNKGITNKFINGPISKKTFLKKKFYGITEYLAQETNSKNIAMIIYNKSLSVCPLTTHLPVKYIAKKITKSAIINKVYIINSFWRKYFNRKPKIAITGLNPHCESIDIFNEDEKIIKPTIKLLKKKNYDISGPFPADTLFLKDNRKKFDVIVGMYHDQVLTPAKTLYEYDAINVTAGLPFIRVSPDHGPNEQMLGKNKSNHLSILRSIQFLDF